MPSDGFDRGGATRLAVLALATIAFATTACATMAFAMPARARDRADGPAMIELVASRGETAAPAERGEDIPGRYAIMRDKRDTGCMLTLDRARASGGERAQLAPGCRDQGIVIFDPSVWALVKGQLVLTARAGHKAVLEHRGEGAWAKAAADGGKPLGLKKL